MLEILPEVADLTFEEIEAYCFVDRIMIGLYEEEYTSKILEDFRFSSDCIQTLWGKAERPKKEYIQLSRNRRSRAGVKRGIEEKNIALVEEFSGYSKDQKEFELVNQLIHSILLSELFSVGVNSVTRDNDIYKTWRRLLCVVIGARDLNELQRRELIKYAEELRGDEIEPKSRFGRDNEKAIRNSVNNYLNSNQD